MQLELQHACEQFEVTIGGEDREIPPQRDGANQEVGVGPLNAAFATSIERIGSVFEVTRLEVDIGKRT